MPMLDAALAFAITMLAVASVVTAIVAKIAARATYRRETFKKQLGTFYEQHVKPAIGEGVDEATAAVDAQANEVIQDVMQQMKLEDHLELSTEELLRRLGESELGRKLQAQAGDQVEAWRDELAKRWEQVGEDFSARFRERARLASFLVGIVVAAMLNVDSIHIIETYLTDDEALAGALGQQESTLAGYADFLGRQPAGTDGVGEAQADLESIRAEIQALKGSGLPMGWDHAPWAGCPSSGAFRPRCADSAGAPPRTTSISWLLWVAGVLMTGYLAGLGAPFWYDLVSGLSNFAQKRRGSRQRNERGQQVPA